MSYTDVMTRVSQISSEISNLQTAFTPPAQTPSATSAAAPATAATAGAPTTGAAMTFSSALSSALGATTAGAAAGSTAGLPPSAGTMLTSAQQQFASRLATDTGLDPGVVSAWLLAEESGGAAVSRQGANNNDWLNIGYTDSGTYGSSGSEWSDPLAAADATAGWLKPTSSRSSS